jgi:hypothetical protein
MAPSFESSTLTAQQYRPRRPALKRPTHLEHDLQIRDSAGALPHPGERVASRQCSVRGITVTPSRGAGIAFTRQKSGRWRVRDRSACSLPVSTASSRDYVWSP